MKLEIFGHDELDYVQLQVLDEDEAFELNSVKGRYMESSVFGLFKICFELSHPDFEYLKENRLSQVVSLRNHLVTNLTRINAVENAVDLEKFVLKDASGIEFMNSLKTFHPEWDLSWEKIRDKLAVTNAELIEMADKCIDDDKLLMVKGF